MNDGLMDLISQAKKFKAGMKSGDFDREIISKLTDFLTPKVKVCISKAVDEWRGTYTPKYYDPTGGLKDMYELKITNKSFHIGFGSEFGGGGYRSPEDVYKIVFKEGYHGGYWRVPLNIWKYRSPRETVKGNSILQSAISNLTKMWDSEVPKKIEELQEQIYNRFF